MMGYPKVSIVVLNWNSWEKAVRCLESLYQITYPNYYVIVVDNGSEDGSVEKMKEWAQGEIPTESKFSHYSPEGKPVSYIEYERREVEAGEGREKRISTLPANKELIIIRNEQNYPYTKANNMAMRYAFEVLNSDYVLIMQSDMVVAPDFLDELINIAKREPDAGILGPKMYFYDEPDKTRAEGGLINYWTGTYYQGGPKLTALAKGKDAVEVDWTPLSCALFSRQVYQTIGLLDEDFVIGIEEVDIGIRATKQGFKVLLVPKSKVWHDSEQPLVTSERTRSLLEYYIPRNRLILLQKHWHGLQLVSATLCFILAHVKYLFLFLWHSRNWNYLKLCLRGLLDYLRWRRGDRQERGPWYGT